MKTALSKILSLFMAIIVMASTMSMTISKHYCSDILIDVSILHKAKSCGMDMINSDLETKTVKKDSCCDDQQQILKGQDELQIQKTDLDSDQIILVVAFYQSYCFLFQDESEDYFSFLNYSPPLVIKPIFKFDETYLI